MQARLVAFAAALAALLGVAPAQAQDWPNRPVRIVSAFAAGGAADIVARTVADHLSNVFKQQFFVEARPGASGTLAVQTVVNSPPDGYNFVVTTSTLLVLLPASKPKLGYDPVKQPDQHRLHRRHADRAVGERQERRQDAQGLRRAREERPPSR